MHDQDGVRWHHMRSARAVASHASELEVIDPGSRRSVRRHAAELWEYRDLVLLLAWRDVAVRYKQAFFGFAWAIVQPVVMAVVFTFFVHRGGQGGDVGMPYPVFAMTGLVPWTFFANAVNSASESLVGSANLVSKVYFPRLAIPVAALLAWLPDFGIATVVLGVVMAIYRVPPSAGILLLPLLVVATVLTALSVGLWTSALDVAYRDVKYAVTFLVQLWLLATPVIYSASIGSGRHRNLYGLNPMVGLIDVFRWAVVGKGPAPWGPAGVSALVVVVLLGSGLRYFTRVERFFADVI